MGGRSKCFNLAKTGAVTTELEPLLEREPVNTDIIRSQTLGTISSC